jgi:DNA mismatch repair protein MutL
MPSIIILPLALQNKIAAGEVVERPASVVKELVENSIDAQSTKIEIDIKHAGRKLIRVSDNGIGMDDDDAITAFQRYATSKIREEADLFNIKTLGFRGEALSSISAVSKIRLSTIPTKAAETDRQKDGGICVESAGGEIKEVKACPAAAGTTIEVRDLFFNTPARKKFLKSDTTENYQIVDMVTRQAIAHYQIAFNLTIDGKNIFNLPKASSEKERLLQIFGKELVDSLIESESSYGWISIKAFLSGDTQFRANKSNQYIFINKRPVRDTTVSQAVYRSYGDALSGGRHPVFFIFLSIDPQRLDFNVHPAKREVRFADKGAIFSFINYSLSQALKKELHYSEGLVKISGEKRDVFVGSAPDSGLSYTSCQQVAENVPLYCLDYMGSIPCIHLGDTFVAIAGGDGLTIIDYHAAHERINYEKLLKHADIPSYSPLFPYQIKLDPSQYKIILEKSKLLNEFGLEIEDFGHGTVIVRSMPTFLEGSDIHSLLSDIAASLANKMEEANDSTPGPLDSPRKILAAKIACHHSIRGHSEAPDGRRIAGLLRELDLTDNPNFCPHGRPTRIVISLNEIKRMFKK